MLLESKLTRAPDANPPGLSGTIVASWDGLGRAPPVAVECELIPIEAGRIEIGPAATAATKVVKHRRMANATRFFLLLILLTLFQGNYRLSGRLGVTPYKSFQRKYFQLYP